MCRDMVPPLEKEAEIENAAVITKGTVQVGSPLVRENSLEMGRVQGGYQVLYHGKIRHPQHTHIAGAPGLSGHPLHEVVAVLLLLF